MDEKISGNENCNIINRSDPAWAMFAAAAMQFADSYTFKKRSEWCADYADAMIRERDRRDGLTPKPDDTELRKAARAVLQAKDANELHYAEVAWGRLRSALEERP